MATIDDDLPKPPKQRRRHHKSRTLTDHPIIDCVPIKIKTSRSVQNCKPTQHSQKHKQINLKKRKSEAAIYINTSKLFPSNTDLNRTQSNGYKKPFRHSTQLGTQNGKRKIKRRVYDNDDSFTPFDFSSYKQQHLQQQPQQNEAPLSPTRQRALACTTQPKHPKANYHIHTQSNNSSNNTNNSLYKGIQFNDNNSTTYTIQTHQTHNVSNTKNATLTRPRPKSVKFSSNKGNSFSSNKSNTLSTGSSKKKGKGKGGISFRKSHNALPVMHPDEVEAIHSKKKKKKDFYKQRASYSAAHFSKHKNQLLTQRNFKKHSGNGTNMFSKHHMNGGGGNRMHIEDDEFLNSLLTPMKKKELNEAIDKLKQVIESNNIVSTIEMSLREVLRKLQLLRLDATLREYRQQGQGQGPGANTKLLTTNGNGNGVEVEGNTTDDEYTISTHSNKISPTPPAILTQTDDNDTNNSDQVAQIAQFNVNEGENGMVVMEKIEEKEEKTKNRKLKEEEQNRILIAIQDRNSNENDDDKDSKPNDSLVSALLFASKYHRNHFETKKTNNVLSKSSHITLTRRRFTLSAATPTDSDRAGIEVAQWLSTRYSTFGRYEIPPSPSNPGSITSKKMFGMQQLSLLDKNSSGRLSQDVVKKRRENHTKVDINRFLKLVTSDQILMRLKGIGDDWNWCIFDLYDICGDSTLLITAHYIFDELNLFDKFNINHRKFESFFSVIQRGYLRNPYHSALHGADVLINIYFWIKSSHEFNTYLSDLDIIIALISAACHDYLHPGLTQNFQIATNSDMALKYNGRSVLENMHCSETIRLLLRSEYAIFKSLKKSEFRYVRELITDMILGTDMQMHSDHVKKSGDLLSLIESQQLCNIDKEKHTKNVLVIGLHVADIANPCKPWLDCKRWTYMLMEEWFRQGDKEKDMGLEVSPMMDRTKPNIPRGQVGFIDYIVKPLFMNWSKLFSITQVCIQHLMLNKENWTLLNADPNANNVQYNLNKLSNSGELNKSKEINLKEPIRYHGYSQSNEEDSGGSNSEFNAVIVRKGNEERKKKKKRKKKRKKKKKKVEKKTSKFSALSVALQNNDSNDQHMKVKDVGNKKVKDVPFTPEQAEALHVTYGDVISSDNDDVVAETVEKMENNNDKIEQSMD